MKKLFLALTLTAVSAQVALCWDYQYEVTKSTFNAGTVSISTSVPTLVSLTPAQVLKPSGSSWVMYSTSLWNVSASTVVYTINNSATVAPNLSCADGLVIGVGSETNPTILTEQFEGLYMWVKACSPSAVTMRRALRGR